MTVKRFNHAYGEVDDNPLGSSATTLTSSNLDRLGAIASADEFARVTLDPGRANGEPEIIHVTDYDGTASSATIERGKEGTTAREHPSGTTWEHAPTVEDFNAPDSGNVLGGEANNESTNVVVGPTAISRNTGGGENSGNVVIGHNAAIDETSSFADQTSCVLIGSGASGGVASDDFVAIGGGAAVGDEAVAVGRSSDAASHGVAIGRLAVSGGGSVAIGEDSDADVSSAIAIGRIASSASRAIALGFQASTTADRAIAVGYQSSAGNEGSVALGDSTTTSASDQVHVGPRHHAFSEVSDPATPPADEARLYARDDGSGNTELVVLFPSGNSTVLANGA